MSDDLNGLDSKINDRGFFERILKEFKETLTERNLRLDERFAAQEKAISKAEKRLDETLHGFPEEYARKEDSERQREMVDARFNKLENFQAKLLGLALAAPFLTGIAVYLLTQ